MRHRYTEAEDRAIARYIALFGFNKGLKDYAEGYNLSLKSVSSRYYRRKSYIDDYSREYLQYLATEERKSSLILIHRIFKQIKKLWKRR